MTTTYQDTSSNNIRLSDEQQEKLDNFGISPKRIRNNIQRAKKLAEERTPQNPIIGPKELTESGFHPVDVWDEVASISHTYFDRNDRFENQDWERKGLFDNLRRGNFGETPYDKPTGESVLASMYGFMFGNNRKIIAYKMENLPYDTKYSRSPKHRKSVLDFGADSEFVFCEELSWELKLQVIDVLNMMGIMTPDKITQYTVDEKRVDVYSTKHVRNALRVLENEKVVRRERDGNQIYWETTGEVDRYIESLENTIEEYTK